MSCEQRGHGNAVSGAKRVTVDQAAWRQAQSAAARLRDVNRELPGMVETLRRQQEAQRRQQEALIQQAAAEARARQDALEQSLAGLSERTSKMQASLARRLQARTERLWREVQDQKAELREETRQALENQEARLQADLAAEREQRELDAQELRAELSELRLDRDRAGAVARVLVADDRVLYDGIDATVPHQQFAPGRLAELRPRLLLAEQSLADGLSEAAVAQAHELNLQLCALRTEVAIRAQDWRAAQVTAIGAIRILQDQLTNYASVRPTDAAGAVLDDASVDVDFWSDGELTALRREADALAQRVASADDPPTTEELRAMARRDVPELDARLTAAVAHAGARRYASQVRVNLAEVVVETLADATGFVWDGEATYAGEDQRREFYAKLLHPDDSEIVVEVAPDESGEGYLVRVLSKEAGRPDESERVERVHAVIDRLRDRGLDVGAPAAEPGEPDPGLFDLRSLGRKAPAREFAVPRGDGSPRRAESPG
jgi:hypothetical protein